MQDVCLQHTQCLHGWSIEIPVSRRKTEIVVLGQCPSLWGIDPGTKRSGAQAAPQVLRTELRPALFLNKKASKQH